MFVVVGKDVNFYLFLAAKCVLSVIADFILIPRMGIYGIAVSNITVNAVLAAVCFVLLSRQNCIKPSWFQKKDISVLKDWGRIGGFSGVQQFINNFIYAVMICKMVNMVAEQGNYWMANNFIWSVLLIPVMALAEVILQGRLCKTQPKSVLRYFACGDCSVRGERSAVEAVLFRS